MQASGGWFMFNYVELIIIDVDCIIPDNHFCNNTRQNCLCILVTFSTSAIVLFQFSKKFCIFESFFQYFFFRQKLILMKTTNTTITLKGNIVHAIVLTQTLMMR